MHTREKESERGRGREREVNGYGTTPVESRIVTHDSSRIAQSILTPIEKLFGSTSYRFLADAFHNGDISIQSQPEYILDVGGGRHARLGWPPVQ